MCIDEKCSTIISLAVPSLQNVKNHSHHPLNHDYIHYDARVTLKTYLPVKKIENKFLVLPGHHNGYS